MKFLSAIIASGILGGSLATQIGFWHEIGRWYNIVFLFPFGLVIVFLVIQILGFSLETLFDIGDVDVDVDASADTDFDAGIDVDADVDADIDVDADVDMDVDVSADIDADADLDMDAGVDADVDADADIGIDADADASADLDADGEVDMDAHADAHSGDASLLSQPGFFVQALVWFGIGKIPITPIISFYLVVFGLTGMYLNFRNVEEGWFTGNAMFPVSFVSAFIGSVLLTKVLSLFWIKYLPINEPARIGGHSFSGFKGDVVSAKIDRENGRALVSGPAGDIHQVFCKLKPGDTTKVKKGDSVVMLKYLPKEKMYYCRKMASE
ncbi:MAG: hypothetical protein ACYS8W_01460 [Planctomycetota bacterium]|jgi:hypothetical protein